MKSKKALVNLLFFSTAFFLFFLICGQALRIESAPAGNSPVASGQADIGIFLNRKELFPDVPPIIDKGRTLVPVRFLLEAMGAQVEWRGDNGAVYIYLEDLSIELVMGSYTARLNGRIVPLEAPARLIGSRAYVPLRFVAENLGATVSWLDEIRSVAIAFGDGFDDSVSGLVREERPATYSDLELSIETYGVALGDAEEKVLQELGEPDRVDPTIYGYNWWVYNQDPLHYLLVGIKGGRVVSVYTCGLEWRFGAVKPGTGLPELKEHFSTADGLYVEETRTIYKLHLPTLIYKRIMITFYYDSLDNNKITAIRLEDRALAEDMYELFFQCRSAQGEGGAYDPRGMREAEMTDERQIFDLANVERIRRGLPALSHNELAAQVAREYSREMFMHNYFDHVSPVTGKTLDQRLDDYGIDFRLAAENIARGQLDGIEVHHGLMNSSRHRDNILNRDLKSLGVGVYRECYTQNFITVW